MSDSEIDVPPVVRLTAEDFMVAATKSAVRTLMAIKKGRWGHDHGSSSKRSVSQRIADGFLGELGEMAVSQFTGNIITSKFENTSASDVGEFEVRTTEYKSGRLLLHKTSPDDKIYILVIVDKFDATICGWIKAKDGKLNKYWKEGNPACFFVPRQVLNPMYLLPNTTVQTPDPKP